MGGEIIEMDVIKAHREGKVRGEKNYDLTPEKAMEYVKKYSVKKMA